MGRAGKLDFSMDGVAPPTASGFRFATPSIRRVAEDHEVSTVVLTAGAAVLFWPAAPAFLLMKGKDVTLNKGMVFDTFTDQDHTINATQAPAGNRAVVASTTSSGSGAVGSGSGSITITSISRARISSSMARSSGARPRLSPFRREHIRSQFGAEMPCGSAICR